MDMQWICRWIRAGYQELKTIGYPGMNPVDVHLLCKVDIHCVSHGSEGGYPHFNILWISTVESIVYGLVDTREYGLDIQWMLKWIPSKIFQWISTDPLLHNHWISRKTSSACSPSMRREYPLYIHRIFLTCERVCVCGCAWIFTLQYLMSYGYPLSNPLYINVFTLMNIHRISNGFVLDIQCHAAVDIRNP